MKQQWFVNILETAEITKKDCHLAVGAAGGGCRNGIHIFFIVVHNPLKGCSPYLGKKNCLTYNMKYTVFNINPKRKEHKN